MTSRLSSVLLTAALTAATAVALAPQTAAATSAPAAAAPAPTTPEARAATLRAKVDKLAIAAEIASEDHADSQAQLGSVMTLHRLAQRQLAAANASSEADSTISDNRVRAIYMTGGKAGLVSGVLGAHDLGDLQARLHIMDDIMRADHARVAADIKLSNKAAAIESQLAKLTAQKLTLQNTSQAAAERVTAALDATKKLLATADATVRRLAEQKRAAEAAAAAQTFAAQLSAARSQISLAGLGSSVAPSGRAAAAITAARTRLGSPYIWGATGPNTFDCSGLTGWAYRQAGLALPRTSRQQWFAGPHVALAGLAPGDLLFWGTDRSNPASIHHVAIYIGGGLMITAPQTGDVVKVQAVYANGYFGAVRPAV